MNYRATLHALHDADLAQSDERFNCLSYVEENALFALLYENVVMHELLTDLLIRDAATDGAFLLQGERDALLHVLNGGSIDDALGTDTGCVAADRNGGGEPVVLLPGNDSRA